jgi:hypothetical protein
MKFIICQTNLQRDEKLGVNFTKPMIAHMDPDACFREGKEVHPLDAVSSMYALAI